MCSDKKKSSDYGIEIPYHEVGALACILLREIQAFFEGEEGQGETDDIQQELGTSQLMLPILAG